MLRIRSCWLFLVGSTLFAASHGALAGTVSLPYVQPFATSVSTNPQFAAAYPEFTTVADTNYVVDAGGVLHLTQTAGSASQLAWVTPTVSPAATEEIIQVDLTASNSNGVYNIGIAFGSGGVQGANFNDIVFHPNFTGAGNSRGGFRVEGPTSGPNPYSSNSDMGYVPPNGDFQHLELDLFPNGTVNFKITDSANAANTFSGSFSSAFDYGADIGLRKSNGLVNSNDAQFANFSVTQVLPAPEPSSLALAIVSALVFVLLAAGRRSARQQWVASLRLV